MRTMIVGAGAAGLYYGAKLAAADERVVFLARDENLAALRTRGVRVEDADGTFTIDRVEAVVEPAQAGACDVVLVSVKTIATQGAALTLMPVVRPETIVVSLQTGIENDETLAAGMRRAPLMRAVTTVAAELVAPAHVRVHDGGEITFGEPDGSRSARAEALMRLFFRAGIRQDLSDDIAAAKWKALAWDVAFNGVCAFEGCTIGDVLAHDGRLDLVRLVMRTVFDVANASGVEIDPIEIDAAIARRAPTLADVRPPMVHDRERGWRLEVDALFGALERTAARVAAEVPPRVRILQGALERYDAVARKRLPHVGVIP